VKFGWPEGNTQGSREWNRRPEFNLNAYRIRGEFEIGFSGAPVYHDKSKAVVGMFAAYENEIWFNSFIIIVFQPLSFHVRQLTGP
jgi:hypothetical protein